MKSISWKLKDIYHHRRGIYRHNIFVKILFNKRKELVEGNYFFPNLCNVYIFVQNTCAIILTLTKITAPMKRWNFATA